jgi:16S rRNA (cytidine1402-2'-O)-methyltransferase
MLYLIATPIGNLGDITLRALEILKSCDYILCEDTRHSRVLLQHYKIVKPLKSFHKFNEAAREEEVIYDLLSGQQIAVISDAGSPGIADPGLQLVQRCRQKNISVSSIPGPCALIAALTISGLETSRFQFIGFLPKKSSELHEILYDVLHYPGVTVCYETAHRLLTTLEILQEIAPERILAVARELTKKFEECIQGSASEHYLYWKEHPPKGEIVLLISGFTPGKEVDWTTFSPLEHVRYLEEQWGLSHKDALKMAAGERGLPKRALYKQILEE